MKVLQSTDFDIVVTGTHNENNFIEQLYFDNIRVNNFAGKTNIPEYASIINAQFVIGMIVQQYM